jgi:hypothetical protein
MNLITEEELVMHHYLSCFFLVVLHMLQQNYQKLISSQGVVSLRVLAVPVEKI